MKRVKGFTLVELVVVIAIIGVLAAILVPAMLGYVQKANRRADMANAKSIYNDIQMTFLDETNYTSHYVTKVNNVNTAVPFESDPMTSFYKNNTATFDEPIDGQDKKKGTYKLTVVCKMDGSYAAGVDGGMLSYWTAGNQEAQGFAAALCKQEGIPTSVKNDHTFGIKLHSRSYDGNPTTRWLIGYRKDNPDAIEIWVCKAKSSWGCGAGPDDVIYRLYPEPAEPYA